MINAFAVCNENYLSFTYDVSDESQAELKWILGESIKQYNTINKTNYDIGDCKYYVIDTRGNETEPPIDSVLNCGNECTEVWIYIQEKSNSDADNTEISRTVEDVDTIQKLISVGNGFEKAGDYSSAAMFYLVSSSGIPYFAHMVKKSYNNLLIEKAKLIIQEEYPEEMDLFLKYINQKENDIAKLCDKLENYDNSPSKKIKHIVKTISKKEPYLLFNILVKNYKLYRYFPIPCRNDIVYSQLIRNLMSVNDISAILREFCGYFINYGEIEKGVHIIGESSDIIHRSSIPDIRKICWVKLIDRDFQFLQSNLNLFFQTNPNLQIDSSSLSKLQKLIISRGNKKNYSSNQASDFQPIKTVDSNAVNIFCILLISLSYLFLSGCYNEFIIGSRLVPNEDIQFKNINKPLPEFKLYLKLLKITKFPMNDKAPNKNLFIIGDEQCLSDFYVGFVHPIPNLRIWSLRKGKHCFEKKVFWNRIKEANKFKGILITLGVSDVRYTIPKLMKNYSFNSKRSYMDSLKMLIDIYLEVLSKIHRKYPDLLIYVGEIRHPFNLIILEGSFNSMLKRSLPEYVNLYSNN